MSHLVQPATESVPDCDWYLESRRGGTRVADYQQEFDDIVDQRRVRAVFQPIVELESGQTTGYEALARGPEGSHFEQPTRLFEYAYQTGRSGELDWVCRASAVAAAMRLGCRAT